MVRKRAAKVPNCDSEDVRKRFPPVVLFRLLRCKEDWKFG